MEIRYSRNSEALSDAEIRTLHLKKACVVGCGGLGGLIADTLARLGVLNLTLIDCDVFDESNLNRQLFSTEKVIGRAKAVVAKERISDVNSSVYVTAAHEEFNNDNAVRLLSGHDLALDALDNVSSRLLLFETCEKMNIPVVHGAIGGWYGQVSTVFPGDSALRMMYESSFGRGIETASGSLPFIASAIASLQCAEAVKILTGRGASLRNSILEADFLQNEYSIIRLSEMD